MTAHTMTPEQRHAVAECIRRVEVDGARACVHWNHCGCCVSVHEDTSRPTVGYVVGPDGGYDLHVC